MIPAPIEKALYGFMASHLLFSGAELGIFDHLLGNPGISIADLAQRTALPETHLARFLGAAAQVDLLERTGATFSIPTELRSFFAEPTPLTRRFSHFQSATTLTFRHLSHALKGEGPQWHRAFPEYGNAHPFELIYQDPMATAQFLETMWQIGFEDAQDLLNQVPLQGYRQLVDLGGGNGSFSVPALLKFPDLSARVFDLAPVEPYLLEKAAQHGVSDRLAFTAGNFFLDPIPSSDLYSMGYILSDWSTEQGTQLLEKVFQALTPGGAILILEKLFDDDLGGPFSTTMLDMAMMVETWGQHRSSSQYRAWLEQLGFTQIQIFRSGGEKHLILGIKA